MGLVQLRLIDTILFGAGVIGAGTILKSRGSDRVKNRTSVAARPINVAMKHIESGLFGKSGK